MVTGDLKLDRLTRLPDDKVIEALVQVKGIGVWTAQMFRFFHSDEWMCFLMRISACGLPYEISTD
jgi:3-methyladenine DNA glycosylase/8-oxoguanine DNA glycosylase